MTIGIIVVNDASRLMAQDEERGETGEDERPQKEEPRRQIQQPQTQKRQTQQPQTQKRQTQQPEKPRSGWGASPIVTYSPETHLGLGAFGVRFFRLGDVPAESRTSSIALVALQTTRGQFIGEFIPEFYWNDERWHFWSKFDYRHYPNALWGVGDDLPEDQEEWYLESGPRWQIWLRGILVYSFYLQGRVDAQYMKIGDTEEGGLLDSEAVPGFDGGVTTGVGLTAGWDTRDHALVPHRGSLHELSIMSWNRVTASRYDFTRYRINLRQYIPVTRTHTLAAQLYGEFLNGEPPFYRMALLGGQYLLRGYFEGRYRDNDIIAAQLEYRLPLYWRISAVVFAAAGDVSDRLSHFGFEHVKWAAGGGLRFMINRDEKLNLRVDGAAGLDTWAIYATAKEAF